ncbi:MAG TPA: pilus assembly protein TadG-related protein, partial [Longimicrobiales bacterium]|nr:pilus assembly protein TadG-related protein [Longimicrobiales bacterium]
MKPRGNGLWGNEQGATLMMVAISLVVILGMGALAIDLAAGFGWRAEAQKIADSGALAGGSAYL